MTDCANYSSGKLAGWQATTLHKLPLKAMTKLKKKLPSFSSRSLKKFFTLKLPLERHTLCVASLFTLHTFPSGATRFDVVTDVSYGVEGNSDEEGAQGESGTE